MRAPQVPPTLVVKKIISGGQTGADRAALDFAIAHNIPHGGWCPANRLAEDGEIDWRYRLKETPLASYSQRTEWNVRDSDATVIFSIRHDLIGGSKLTADFAALHKKPILHLSKEVDGLNSGQKLRRFLEEKQVAILNVAGPRLSTEPEIGIFTTAILEQTFFPKHLK